MIKNTLFLFSFFLVFNGLLGQSTIVRGIISDIDTDEPLPFVNLSFCGSSIGTMSNINGEYVLETNNPKDSLEISFIGYTKKVVPIQIGKIQNLNIELKAQQFELEAVEIRPGKNPANAIIKNAANNRITNNPGNFDSYTFDLYSKIQASISNLDNSNANRKVFTKNPDILVVESDSNLRLPLYFTEKIYTEYKDKSLAGKKIVVSAMREEGAKVLTDNLLDEYAETLTEEICFYNNFLFLMKNDFVSPISSYALMYYKFVITDTIFEDNNAYYKINFWPRRKKDRAFYGDIYIHDKSFGLKEINARLSASANLNYVQDIKISETYQIQDDIWVPETRDLYIEYKVFPTNDTAKMKTINKIVAEKSDHFRNFKPSFSEKEYLDDISKHMSKSFENKAINNDTAFWNKERYTDLSATDEKVISSIGNLNDAPSLRFIDRVLNMGIYGFYDLGKIELGPYLMFYAANAIEGSRFNFAAKTSPELIKNSMIWGNVGYGIKDEKFKYGFKIGQKLPTYKRQIVRVSYTEDVIFIGNYQMNLKYVRENLLVQNSDALSSVVQSDLPEEVYFIKNAGVQYEMEWEKGRMSRISGNYFKHYSPPFYPFSNTPGEQILNFENYEITLNTRIAFNQNVSDYYFRRIYLDTKKPIFNVDFTYGNYQIEDNWNDYYKIRATVKHNTNIAQGELEYIIEAGKYFGKLPYPLLEIARSDVSIALGNYYFNRLNYMEYAADQFAALFLYYNLNGLILHSVPLIKHLNFREVITFKAFYGNYNYKHDEVLDIPMGLLNEMKYPYMELGLGLSNIFKIGRIEYIWRLTDRNDTDVKPQGLHITIQVEL